MYIRYKSIIKFIPGVCRPIVPVKFSHQPIEMKRHAKGVHHKAGVPSSRGQTTKAVT